MPSDPSRLIAALARVEAWCQVLLFASRIIAGQLYFYAWSIRGQASRCETQSDRSTVRGVYRSLQSASAPWLKSRVRWLSTLTVCRLLAGAQTNSMPHATRAKGKT